MPLSTSIRPPRRRAVILSVLISLLLGVMGLSSGASANTTPLGATQILNTPESSSTCVNPLIVQPFKAFGDRRDYVLGPGGDFEGAVATGWQLAGGAQLAAGGRNSAGSLSLPPGASAITPAMCIDLTYPHMRFYSKAMGNAAHARVGVEVVYPDVRNPAFEEIKQFDGKQGTAAGLGWRLSDDVDLKPDLGGQRNVTRRVALRFSSLGSKRGGDVRIDDVYVDPKRL
jgi:hypothetical protein